MKGDSLAANNSGAAAEWYRKALAALLKGVRVEQAENAQIQRLNQASGKNATPNGWMSLYAELARTYLRLGQPDAALNVARTARARRPDSEFSEELSQAWQAKGDPAQAALALIEGLVIDPNASQLAADLAELYRKTAAGSCAIANSAAGGINLQCPLVHDQFCSASRNVALFYQQRNQPAKASATVRSAIQDFACPAQTFATR
jgi:tetratricopeptide (TPR) repeat protein